MVSRALVASTLLRMLGGGRLCQVTTAAAAFSTPSPPGAQSQATQVRILCYGDSLTAGTAPPLDPLYPYGSHLERALNGNGAADSHLNYVVRWRGLPGWTAKTMLHNINDSQTGLRPAVKAVQNPPLSLVIVLAGSNDIAFATTPNEIFDPLVALHQACFKEGVRRTVAVGIPQSAWQMSNTAAAAMAKDVNQALERYCAETQTGVASGGGGIATYVEFPFSYETGNERWCADGLHLTPIGYEAMGVGLAPSIRSVLSDG